MKKLHTVFLIPVILILTTPLTLTAHGQSPQTTINIDIDHLYRPFMSGIILAYHDVIDAHDPEKDIDIIDILDFIDESIKKKALLGYESDPIYGKDPLAGKRLNVLKATIEKAIKEFENGTFDEACRLLLEAYLSCDGSNFQYIDLVYGPAASELAEMIKLVKTLIIGCSPDSR